MPEINDYETIDPPIVRREIDEMNRREARQFFAWFRDQIPIRSKMLQDMVRYEVDPAVDPDSAIGLVGEFLDDNAVLRMYTEEELIPVREGISDMLEELIGPEILTELTLSLCIDIGMVFGSTMIRRHPHLKWELVIKPKKHIDFHQSIIVELQRRVPSIR